MYYTHYFANRESLARARAWLSRVGFGVESIEAHTDGIPRITVAVDPTHWSGVEMLISAIERSDPCGWPGYWDVANLPHVYPAPFETGEGQVKSPHGGSTAIGWHPADRPSATAQEQELIDSESSVRERWS